MLRKTSELAPPQQRATFSERALGILEPRQALKMLVAALAVLGALHMLSVVVMNIWGQVGFFNGLVMKLNLDAERAIPSHYSSVLLMLAAGLLYVVSRMDRPEMRRFWRLMTGVFVFLSFDEAASLHEMLVYPLNSRFEFARKILFSWVLILVPMVAALFVYSIRYLFKMPRRMQKLVVASGFIFVVGMLVFELLAGLYVGNGGSQNGYLYGLMVLCEESAEIFGVSLFIYSLLVYVDLLARNEEAQPTSSPSAACPPTSAPSPSAATRKETASSSPMVTS
ncbi:MAG: hypothetical protein AAGG50_17325 [Bacteroidota bacterium]